MKAFLVTDARFRSAEDRLDLTARQLPSAFAQTPDGSVTTAFHSRDRPLSDYAFFSVGQALRPSFEANYNDWVRILNQGFDFSAMMAEIGYGANVEVDDSQAIDAEVKYFGPIVSWLIRLKSLSIPRLSGQLIDP